LDWKAVEISEERKEMQNNIREMLSNDKEFRTGRRLMGRMRTRDAAFTFRMGTGFAGMVTRTHPQGIEPAKMDTTFPVLGYGLGVFADNNATNGVRGVQASDSALTSIYGVSVRPFPISPSTAVNFGAAAFGNITPPTAQPLDVLKSGYIIVSLQGATASFKGAPVFIYYGVSGGGHIQGGFEAAAGANLAALDATGNRIYFNGPAGADGLVELVFNP
jgi:hypothetical protein